MSIVFTILFLMAVVGIIKPYFTGMTRGRFAILAIVCFVLIAVSSPKNEDKIISPAPAITDTDNTQTSLANTPSSMPTALPESKWEYNENKDAMRGTTSRFASIKSENQVDLDFPNGETYSKIVIRRNGAGLNIYLSVDSGQILCDEFSHRTLSVKFDNGPVEKMGCNGTSDGSNDTAFFKNEAKMLAGLRRAKQTIIEAEFFQKGDQQFTFDTAGLDWK